MGIGPREGVLLGANLGRSIVTNGDFSAYVCYSAATRPSSQITLGRLVFKLIICLRITGKVFSGLQPTCTLLYSSPTAEAAKEIKFDTKVA